MRAVLTLILVLVCLAALHLCLFTAWYSGLRGFFTRSENVHVKDIQLAISAGAVVPKRDAAVQEGRLALLFMLKTHLVEIEVWRRWLHPEDGREPQVSIFVHLAHGNDPAAREALEALPAKVITSVATGWCELMAAEVALFRSALQEDPLAEMFVLLPHDAVPLWPRSQVLSSLLSAKSLICPAGVRDIDVPHDCAHGIEPHWARSLVLKHHQWLALRREHAALLVDPGRLAAANDLFESDYLGEPLCSDEVLPLLTLAVQGGQRLSLSTLPLYRAAAQDQFEEGLRHLGLRAECILYAPWPGCGSSEIPNWKRAKSPVLGGGLAPAERDALLHSLAQKGVLFARKLGLSGGNSTSHMEMLSAVGSRGSRPAAPGRLLPLPKEECCSTLVMIRWALASLKALLPVPAIVVLAAALAWAAGRQAIAGGLPETSFCRFIAIYAAGHVAVFLFSIVAFSEYSLLEPFRKLGLQRAEL